jgi:glycine hydroxymethyltransferase
VTSLSPLPLEPRADADSVPPKVARVIGLGEDAARRTVAARAARIDLVASHALMSPAAAAAARSALVCVPSSGSPRSRHHTGPSVFEEIEQTVDELACELFGASDVEHRAASGSMANALFALSVLGPDDWLLVVPAKAGGHRTYARGGLPTMVGARVEEMAMRASGDYPFVDLDALESAVRDLRPSWLVVGTSSLLVPYDLRAIRQIADQVGARIWYDGAHILGLAAGGQFQDPLREGADVLTGSTQKTLCGPLGGLVLTRDPQVGAAVRRGTDLLLSNYSSSQLAALATTLAEFATSGTEFAARVVANARQLGSGLSRAGLQVVGAAFGFTNSHIVLVDCGTKAARDDAVARLEAVGVDVSTVRLPSSTESSGIRLGTTVCTRLGMDEGAIDEIARIVAGAVDATSTVKDLREATTDLARAFAQGRSGRDESTD